jgi:hypothetical protein
MIGSDAPVAAVTISGAPVTERSLAPAVLTTARSIARAMGAPATGPIAVVR